MTVPRLPRSSKRVSLAALAVGAMLLAAGCASSGPVVHLHSLMPVDPPVRLHPSMAPMPIVLEPVRLPAQVDQPQWLVQLPDDSLVALEQERWASPLGDEFRQALLEELGAHAGVIDGRGGNGAEPARVAVELRRFDSLPGREARIEGTWTIRGAGSTGESQRCEWLYRESAPGGMIALARAHRRAVVRLADAIGDALLDERAGRAFACPPSDRR